MQGVRQVLQASVALAAIAAWSAPAGAQTDAARAAGALQDASPSAENGAITSGEILVTARRREEDIQTVPVSVTVVSGADVEAKRLVTMQDLVTATPSLTYAPSNGNSRFADSLTIRGQGGDGGVVQYFAEVPNAVLRGASLAFNTSFYDIASVQVLNGPQGTLFGKTTTGGAVLITPQRPTEDTRGYIALRVGNYNAREVEGAMGGSVGESGNVLVRAAFYGRFRDGFTRNLQGSALDDVDKVNARFSLILKPAEGFENYTIGYYEHSDENQPGSQITAVVPTSYNAAIFSQLQDEVARRKAGGPRVTDITPYSATHTAYGVINTTTIDLNSNLRLKNIASYRESRSNTFFNNFDGSSFPLFDLAPIPGFKKPSLKTWTEELQLAGELFDGRVSFQTGVYGDRVNGKNPDGFYLALYNPLPAAVLQSLGVPSEPFGTGARLLVGSLQSYNQTSRAAYLHLEGEITPELTLSGGVRRTHDKGQNFAYTLSDPYRWTPVRNPAGDNGYTSKATTWDVTLDYKVSPDIFTYASVRRGYRPGGNNLMAPFVPYDPEVVTDYEVGIKTAWTLAGMQGLLNVDAYYDKYKNIQRVTAQIVNNAFVSNTINAAAATIKGIDVMASIEPTTFFDISVNYSHIDASFDSYLAFDLVTGAPLDLSNNRFGNVPKNKYTITPRLHFPVGDGEASLLAQIYHSDSRVLNDRDRQVDPATLIPGYTLVTLRAELTNIADSGVSVGAFVTNLFNKTYLVSKLDATIGTNPLGHQGSLYGEPRMYGLTATAKF
jgi:iron complex outermembrane recepter protein